MNGDNNAAGMEAVVKALNSVNENLAALNRRMNDDKPKQKQDPHPYYGPPFPPTDAMGAFGPMMMAWALSWLYANPRSEPSMLDSMTRFAASRESFWHNSTDILADMSRRSAGAAAMPPKGFEPVISEDDKKKVIAALTAEGVDEKTIDCVIHGMKLQDFFLHFRSRELFKDPPRPRP